MKDEHVYTVMN